MVPKRRYHSLPKITTWLSRLKLRIFQHRKRLRVPEPRSLRMLPSPYQSSVVLHPSSAPRLEPTNGVAATQEQAPGAGRTVWSPARYAGLLLSAPAVRQKGGATPVPTLLRRSIRSNQSRFNLENWPAFLCCSRWSTVDKLETYVDIFSDLPAYI